MDKIRFTVVIETDDSSISRITDSVTKLLSAFDVPGGERPIARIAEISAEVDHKGSLRQEIGRMELNIKGLKD